VSDADSVWFCYMLRCNDDSFYVGIAIDVEDRVKRHNSGVGPRYTANRRPVELVWSECCGNTDAARAREKELKGWNRRKKLQLIAKTQGKPFALAAGSG